MTKMTSRIRVYLAVMASVLGGACPGPWGRAEEAPDVPIVARVGEATITRPQLDSMLRRGNAAGLPAGTQRIQAEAAALQQLVDEALLRQALAKAGVVADPAAIDANVEQLRKQVADRGGTLAAALAQTGRDEAALREQVAMELAMRRFVEQRLTPQAVESYFEKNRRELDGTLVRVSHLVLRPDLGRGETAVDDCLARAAAIRGRVVQGEMTFAQAVRAHSAGPSRRRDGDVGYLPFRSAANEEFARQSFALAKGEISKPFVTPFGVHVVQVTDVQPGQRALVGMRQQIEQILSRQIVRDTLAEARGSLAIEYAPGVPHFDPATPDDAAGPRRVVVQGAAATP